MFEWIMSFRAEGILLFLLVAAFFFGARFLRAKSAVSQADLTEWEAPSRRKKVDAVFVATLMVLIVGAVCTAIIMSAVFYHFQLGQDIPFLAVKNKDSAAYWGQIGDFIGGVLNPVLSFVALLAVIINLNMQRKELELARKDASESRHIQNKQSAILDKQSFETVFFKLLDVHSRLAGSIQIRGAHASAPKRKGSDAFKAIEKKHLNFSSWLPSLEDDGKSAMLASSRAMMENYSDELGHYFRNMYQVLKYVDGFGQDALRSRKYGAYITLKRAIENYSAQRAYSNMLRAQLSPSEVSVIYLNCLTPKGAGLKYYVEKFSLLKDFERSSISGWPGALGLFNELAYADSESISNTKLRAIIEMHIYKRDSSEPSV